MCSKQQKYFLPYDVNYIFQSIRMEGFKSINLTICVVIFALFVQNAYSRAEYARYAYRGPRNDRIIEKSSYPKYKDVYLNCRHQICSNTDDYPEEDILRVMRNTKHLEGLFGIVLNSTYDVTELASRSNFGGAGKAKKLCITESSQTHQPRVLRNIDLRWRYVVNVEGYYQRFTAEMCRNVNSSTSTTSSTPKDPCREFDQQCKQSYQELYLLTYEDGIIDFDKFLIPTTCNCVCDA